MFTLQLFFFFLNIIAYELIHRVDECLLVYVDILGALADVCGTKDSVGYDRYAFNDAVYRFGTFYRIGYSINKEVCLESDEVGLMLFHVIAIFGGVMFARKTVRVIVVRQQKYFYVHTFGEKHIDTSY